MKQCLYIIHASPELSLPTGKVLKVFNTVHCDGMYLSHATVRVPRGGTVTPSVECKAFQREYTPNEFIDLVLTHSGDPVCRTAVRAFKGDASYKTWLDLLPMDGKERDLVQFVLWSFAQAGSKEAREERIEELEVLYGV